MSDLDYIFKPKSIAVIGASRTKGSIGREILHNLIDYGFNGMVFPVNPKADVIHSIKCYHSVLDIPDPVDAAVIVVPKEYALNVIEECGQKGVKGLVVITAGFRETGEHGAGLEEELIKVIKKYNMRMVGPNCMGVVNTAPAVRMDATFAPEHPLEGKVGFLSQSGGLGVVILNLINKLNLGFSMFVSLGNKTDISGNDILEYWEDDHDTAIILMYLESFGNPRKFTRMAKRISRKKPLIAVKAGRTTAGARAASSHTGALAEADIAADALFDQCGVIRVSSIEEMFDLALAFSDQPLPEGNRVAILTNTGGPGIMATDACANLGLDIVDFSGDTKKKLAAILPDEASISNPLDLIASGGPEDYARALDLILKDPKVDSVIVISVPPIMLNPLEVAVKIADVAAQHKKPVLGCFMGKEIIYEKMVKKEIPEFPIYQFPESPAKALAAMVKYKQWQKTPEGNPVEFKVDKDDTKKIIEKALKERKEFLSESEVFKILNNYGFPTPKSRIGKTHEEVADMADKIGYPVVLKVSSDKIIHKSDVGGVEKDLRNRGEVIEGYYNILKKLKEKGVEKDFQGIKVQEMVKGGKEVIMGMSTDPQFGPLIMFGMGGIYVEVLKDIVFKIAPITDFDAKEMVESVKSYPLLKGIRGEKGVDIRYITECLLRLSQLITDFEEIKEIDLNPFIVSHKKSESKVVDARIKVG